MLGSVGDDQLGVAALETLRANDVQTDHVVVDTRRTHRRRAHRRGHRRREPDLGRARRERHPRAARRRRRARDAETARGAREPRGSRADGASRARVGPRSRRDHDPQSRAATAMGTRPRSAFATLRHAQRARASGARDDPCGASSSSRPVVHEGAMIHRPDGSEEAGPRPERPGRGYDRRRRLLQRRARGRPRVGHRAHHSRTGRGPGRFPLRRHRRRPRGHARCRMRSRKRGSGSGARARASRGTPRPARDRTRRPGPSPGCSTRRTPR